MPAIFKNNAASVLAATIQLNATTAQVTNGTGNRFPAPAAGEFFYATIQAGADWEIVKCTARAGDVLTIERAQDGSQARLWGVGAAIDMRIPSIVLESFLQVPIGGNIPMGGNRITGLANAIASTDAATLGQVTTLGLTKAGDTMTGALGVVAGTAAAPGVFVSGDSNTGLFQPSPDTLAVTVGGVEIIRFSVNGFGFVGQIAFFPTNAAPNGWLKANGALLSRSAYPALWTFANASGNIVSDATWTATNGPIGSFSTGDGSTTFRIPDLRGEFLRGWDDARGVDSGRAIGTFQDGQLLSHGHTLTDPGHSHGIAGNNGGSLGILATRDVANDLSYALAGSGTNQISSGTATTGITIANTGGAENRPRNVALLACIKF